jgi:cyclic pyranopterin phosphate synthase
MYDSYNRRIDYLRISVTDKCNLRCRYCMPEEGVALRRHEDYLSFEQITEVVRAAVKLGVIKVRLTGGEPLVKRGIVGLVRMLHGVRGLKHLAMTTNGTMLTRYARGLKAAGLDSLNISLDTLDPERYRYLTRRGEIEWVLQGIEAARAEGFPVKINMVVLEDTSQQEIEGLRRFCSQKGLKLQLINHFSLGAEKMDDYHFDRPPRCEECNKIRMLADGFLKPCLQSDQEIPIDMNDIEGSLLETVARKPERGSVCTGRSMMEIGG